MLLSGYHSAGPCTPCTDTVCPARIAAVRTLCRRDQEGLGHIGDRAVAGQPFSHRAVGAAAAVLFTVKLHHIPRAGLEVLDAVRQGNAAVVVVGELRLIIQRTAGGVEAGQVGGAAGLGQAVQEGWPCACVKVVPRLCVHQNGVLRRLGGCVLQQLQAGVKAAGQLRFGGQGVDQLCCLRLRNIHRAAGALAACRSCHRADAGLHGSHRLPP